jgi:hypothetical protein
MGSPGAAGECAKGEDHRSGEEDRQGDHPQAAIESVFEYSQVSKGYAQQDADGIGETQAKHKINGLALPSAKGREDWEGGAACQQQDHAGPDQHQQVQGL